MFSVPPEIDERYASSPNQTVLASRTLTIACPVSGTPTPYVNWYHDGVIIHVNNDVRLRTTEQGTRLELTDVDEADSGRYTCEAENEAGHVTRDYDVDVWGRLYG